MNGNAKINDKVAALLGFAVKGRKLIYGLDNIEAYRGRIYGIYYDGGLSEKSLKNARYFAGKKGAALIRSETPVELWTGKKNCKAAALTDGSMHAGIMKELAGSAVFREDRGPEAQE